MESTLTTKKILDEFNNLFKDWNGERYNQEQLDFFKKLINEKIAITEKEILLFQGSILPPEELTGDDRYRQIVENEKLIVRISRLRKFLRDLKQALIRIHNKTYGICKISKEIIPPIRLLAVPHTTTLVKFKR